jgi:hypothetical protein
MSVEEVIISAVNNKISLQLDYDHHMRLISPCRYGWKTTEEDGLHKILFCYQFGGYNSKGLKPDGSMENFRCWKLDKIYSAVPIKDPWSCPQAWPEERSRSIDDVIAGPPY